MLYVGISSQALYRDIFMKWMNYKINSKDSMESTRLAYNAIDAQIKKYGKATVYGFVNHVSSSGTLRVVTLFVVSEEERYSQNMINLAKQYRVSGCGFDAVHDTWRKVGMELANAGFMSLSDWFSKTIIEYV